MSEVKARLMGAITVMDEENARRLWSIVERLYSADGWDAVEEEAPDAVDLEMLRELQADPDCSTIATPEEIQAVLG